MYVLSFIIEGSQLYMHQRPNKVSFYILVFFSVAHEFVGPGGPAYARSKGGFGRQTSQGLQELSRAKLPLLTDLGILR